MTNAVVAYNYISEHDIHEFIFSESSRQSIEEYYAYIDEVYNDYMKGKEKVRFLLDIHVSGMLPIKYNNYYLQQSIEKQPDFPPSTVVYLISSNPSDRTLINNYNYNTTIIKNKRITFDIQDRDQAIKWLATN